MKTLDRDDIDDLPDISALANWTMNPNWQPEDIVVDGVTVGRIESAGDPVWVYLRRRGGGEVSRLLRGDPRSAKAWAAAKVAEGYWRDGFDEREIVTVYLAEVAAACREVEALSPSRFRGLGLVRVFSPSLIHIVLDRAELGLDRYGVPWQSSFVCRSAEEARDVLSEAAMNRNMELNARWDETPEGREANSRMFRRMMRLLSGEPPGEEDADLESPRRRPAATPRPGADAAALFD